MCLCCNRDKDREERGQQKETETGEIYIHRNISSPVENEQALKFIAFVLKIENWSLQFSGSCKKYLFEGKTSKFLFVVSELFGRGALA